MDTERTQKFFDKEQETDSGMTVHPLLRSSAALLLERHAQLVSRLYDKWADGISKAEWYRDERIFERIDSIVSFRPRRVLEIGFGNGRILRRLASKLPEAAFEGVDVSHRMHHLALEQCRWLPNVALYEGDWIDPVMHHEPYDIILIKNALHLVRGLGEKLRALSRVSHGKTKLVVIETVSPSNASREFVAKMFRRIDRQHVKVHFFTRQSLWRALKEGGWDKRHYAALIDQKLSIDKWLQFKLDSKEERVAIRNWILQAPLKIKDEMNISDEHGPLTMLRRQTVLIVSQKTDEIIPFRR